MQVDYRNYPAGCALAPKVVLSTCPLCGKSCHYRELKASHRYAHKVDIWNNRVNRRARVKIVEKCRETKVQRLKREAINEALGITP